MLTLTLMPSQPFQHRRVLLHSRPLRTLTICRAYHKLLSEPQEVLLVDFQQIIKGNESVDTLLQPIEFSSLPVTEGGSCNALICWFEVSSPSMPASTWHHCLLALTLIHPEKASLQHATRPCEVQANLQEDSWVSSWKHDKEEEAACQSFQQAFTFWDPITVDQVKMLLPLLKGSVS